MKLANLEFKTVGCCGEHSLANVGMPDGSKLTIYDDGEAGYRIVPTFGGVLRGKIISGASAAEVEALLPT